MTREPAEADPSLRRIQRDSAVIAIVSAALALAAQRGRPGGAIGVLAGAAIMAFSYGAIRGGVNAVVRKASAPGNTAPDAAASRRRTARAFAGFIGRYLVIGVASWAVLVPLRVDPLGLFAGVSVPVLAIGVEAIRLVRAAPRRRRGQ